MTIRLTHISRRRDHCPWDLDDGGFFIRFAGDTEEWEELRDDLKTWGRSYARWIPEYEWSDEKRGAWWVDEDLFRDTYIRRFSNLDARMLNPDLDPDERREWRYRGRRGWEGTQRYTEAEQEERWRQQRERYEQQQSAPHQDTGQAQAKVDPSIPSHLIAEYAMLELTGKATADEVKVAYRRLSKRYHPDAGGSHQQFINLQRAYDRVNAWLLVCAS